jgi:hypothetical protein
MHFRKELQQLINRHSQENGSNTPESATQKLCDMQGVREYQEGDTVQLWRVGESGRLVVRAYNECGNRVVDIDLWDILDWLQAGPHE